MTPPASGPIRVMLVDDHALVLHGLRAVLDSAPALRVVGQTSDSAEALAMHRKLQPDVTLLDVRMPGTDGLGVLEAIRADNPTAIAIMLASDNFRSDVLRAWQLGAAGFLLKTASRKELLDEVEHAFTFGWCHPYRPGTLPDGARGENVLSARELEVLDYVRRGFSNPDIATALCITEHTIKAHLKIIFNKLECADRTEAVVAAFERGLFRVSPDASASTLPPT